MMDTRKDINELREHLQKSITALTNVLSNCETLTEWTNDKERELYELHPQVQAAHDELDALVKQKRALETQIAKLTA
jgi:hypothetical protein